jgi:hypothetical protein
MLRYHKEVFFSEEAKTQIKDFTEELNILKWNYSNHCLENIKDRIIDLEATLRFIKGLRLDPEAVFEYYASESGQILKACYRIELNPGQDIILVMAEDKTIVTIYINSREDRHITLKKELYNRG